MTELQLNIVDDSNEKDTDDFVSWHIAIIDDEESMHVATKLALANVEIKGRPLKFYSAYSAAEGKELLKNQPDIAVVLLDVVMETSTAGLDLASQIRNELEMDLVQIILRTGQPGYAPEERIIRQFEINDYKEKSELTRNKLFSCIATALRSYNNLLILERSRLGLRSIIDASANVFKERSVESFSQGVLQQINDLFDVSAQGIFCVSQRPHNKPVNWVGEEDDGYYVIATTDSYSSLFGVELAKVQHQQEKEAQMVKSALDMQAHVLDGQYSCLYLSTPSGWEGAILIAQGLDIENLDNEMLTIFCVNVALGLENAKFFTHLNTVAYFDHLTGIYSRTGLLENLPQGIENQDNTVQIIDIDYFRDIADNLGHKFGDKVLKSVANYLSDKYGGQAMVARLHSDVFALLFLGSNIEPSEINTNISKSILVDGNSLRLGVTLGIANYSPDDEVKFDIETLLRHAEIAMKVAKENNRGKSQLFDPAYESESKARLILLNDLRAAFIHQELFLQLQPKVDINDSSVVGYEALLRWLHPQKGMISPGLFIPVAEKSGLYFDLDLYVFRKSLKLITDNPEIVKPVSINISAQSLNHHDLVSELYKIWQKSGVPIEQVELEITENALVRGNQALENLHELKGLGFKLCLDDFGTGYSSLSYLLTLPLDVIKIDRAFVVAIENDERALTVLSSMVEMSHKLNKTVIVEGVENISQLKNIKKMGVKYVQGFYFFKPLMVGEIKERAL